MKHIAAYLLLVLGGNESPTADDVSNALSEVGVETDSERLSALMSELEGKDLNELLAQGKEMLAKFGGGGGGGGGAGGDAGEAEAEEEEVCTMRFCVNIVTKINHDKNRLKKRKKKLTSEVEWICSVVKKVAETIRKRNVVNLYHDTISLLLLIL